ncbi:MAG: GIY-YIG nuclease family protein [Nitrospira sp.]
MASSTRTKVYFIENVDTGRIKVGFTTSAVHTRLKAFQTGTDCELRIIGVITADVERETTEAQLHLRFSKYHHRGEWYTREILPMVLDLLRLEEDLRLGRS